MGRHGLRFVLLGLIARVAAGAFIGSRNTGDDNHVAQTSGSSKSGQCSNGAGVSVVIDFGRLRQEQPIAERCVLAADKSTGWQVLEGTGFEISGTSLYPSGFVCRIDGQPSPAKEKCEDTPSPTNGSWAYFYADAGSGKKWVFSGAGAGFRRPTCGSVEGWRFISPGDPATTPPAETPSVIDCGAE